MLHVREDGRPDGPPIVFLHGAGVSGTAFQTIVRGLPEFRCLRLDLPEHGHSETPAGFSIPGAADEVAAWLAPFEGRVALVGHSLGAQVALHIAAAHPRAADRMVLFGAMVNGWPALRAGHALARALPRRPVRLPAHEAVLRVVEVFAHVPPAERAAWTEDLHHVRLDAFARAVTESLSYRPPASLAAYPGELLVILGARDYGPMRASARQIGRLHPRARVMLARAAPHTWHLERPTLLIDTLRAWLGRQPLPPELEPMPR